MRLVLAKPTEFIERLIVLLGNDPTIANQACGFLGYGVTKQLMFRSKVVDSRFKLAELRGIVNP